MQPKCPTTDEWVTKTWCVCVCVYIYIYIHIQRHTHTHTHTECYSAVKRIHFFLFATTWIDLSDITK